MPQDSPTSVYKYYDAHGLILYVGITSRGTTRNGEHNRDKEWWPFVVRQEVEHHPTRAAALDRERSLIRRYRPPFNVVHNLGHEETRSAYLTFRESKATPSILIQGLVSRNRVDMDVKQIGDRLFLSYDGDLAAKLPLETDPFPIAGARFEEFGHDGRTILVRATVRGGRQIQGAQLMFRFESQRPMRLGYKRIDLSLFPTVVS